MAQSDGTIVAAVDALNDLVATARGHAAAARDQGREGWAQNWDTLAYHLDATRTTLVQEGDDYLPVAWAFVDSGRLTIVRYMARIGRRTA